MKCRFALFATVIALTVASSLVLAQEPKNPASASTEATPAMPLPEATLVTLSAKDPLPAAVKSITIVERDPGDKEGASISAGSPIMVHYTGWIYEPSKPDGKGKQFDSSIEKRVPFGFIVGAGRVIQGWDKGFAGMKLKGKRTLIIPAEFAYGNSGTANIPPGATLIFDVELIRILGPAINL